MVKFFGRKQKADKVLVEVVPAGTRGRMEVLEMDVSAARDSAQAWKSRALDGDAFAGRLEADLNVARAECEVLRAERDELRAALDCIGYRSLPGMFTGGKVLTAADPGAISDGVNALWDGWWRGRLALEAVEAERDELREAIDTIARSALPGDGSDRAFKTPGVGADPALVAAAVGGMFWEWWDRCAGTPAMPKAKPAEVAEPASPRVFATFADVPDGVEVTDRDGDFRVRSHGVAMGRFADGEGSGSYRETRWAGRDHGPFTEAAVVEPRVWQTIEDVPEGIKVEDKTADGDRWWWEGDTLKYQYKQDDAGMNWQDSDSLAEADCYAPFTEVQN